MPNSHYCGCKLFSYGETRPSGRMRLLIRSVLARIDFVVRNFWDKVRIAQQLSRFEKVDLSRVGSGRIRHGNLFEI